MSLTLSFDDVMAMVEEDFETMIAVEATVKITVEGNSGKSTQSLVVPTSIVH